MRILIAQLNPTVGAIAANSAAIIDAIETGKKSGVALVLFSELAITGYPPGDLLLLPHFIDAVEAAIRDIAATTHGIAAIVGLPRRSARGAEKPLYNSAAICIDGAIAGYQDKTLLPDYDIFDERRYFSPADSPPCCWSVGSGRVAITLCEDIWGHQVGYRSDPIAAFKEQQPNLLVNLSASPYCVGKNDERFAACSATAQALHCPVVLCNQVGGNDSLIFDGTSCHVASDGTIQSAAPSFSDALFVVETADSSVPPDSAPSSVIEEIHNALVLGIRDYCRKTGFSRACLGLSGGVDSALVAVLGAEALGHDNLLAITMPSRYSSTGSRINADALISNLGIRSYDISIESPFAAFLALLDPHFTGHDTTTAEENLQARIRGMILMAFSNTFGHLPLSTGNKSEMAMGYSTLYGDMCGGLGVINDLTKEQVYALCHWINRNEEVIPNAILTAAPSAELRPDQKDCDTLPDYPVVDAILQAYIVDHQSPATIAQTHGFPLALVEELVKKIHFNEYKRRQSPPGLRISARAFSAGRRFPIAQRWV